MQRDGKQQHAEARFHLSSHLVYPALTTLLQGETEKKTAQAADAADGLYNQVAGKVNNVIGSLMGDQSKEASGKFYSSLVLTCSCSSIPPSAHVSSLPTLPSCPLRPLACPFIRALFHRPVLFLHSPTDSRVQARRKKSPVKPRRRPTSLFRVVFYSCTMAAGRSKSNFCLSPSLGCVISAFESRSLCSQILSVFS
jgi:hypothetical protein